MRTGAFLCPTSHCPNFTTRKGNLTPELAQVIDTIAATCKTIDQALQKGALAGILGSAGNENVQGETQKNLM